ncbi:nucleotide-diphospho-sugar transferase [Kineococcus sp. SYSU DK001]|uniref:nucleotide-diphospho-sugar transferase n=1 Tax=Kineococcus sp. SYSU DK001 TaxID=3383122 RepID=UPI003D7D4F13
MVIVLAEDRPSHRVGVEIAVVSLLRHCPDAEVHLHCPWADDRFTAWAARLGVAEVHTSRADRASGWNVKPHLLLEHLAAGREEVVWVDADVLTQRDWRPLLAGHGPDVLVATEETFWGQAQGGTHRTRAWGLEVGRSMPWTVNTGLVRVTRAHVGLLTSWAQLLSDPRYLQAQRQPWQSRPLHLLGDQEVLTALLGSTAHAAVPVHLLEQGTDIAQCFGPAGFTPGDRVRAALSPAGVPPLVHAMGPKPWQRPHRAPGVVGALRAGYDRAHAASSPYTVLAARHREDLMTGAGWLPRRSGARRASLTGLPLAVVDDVVRRGRRRLGVGRYHVEGADQPR